MIRFATQLSMALMGLLFAASAAAGPLEDGNAAWLKGDYARAMTLLRPLADKGSARAQGLVGRMFEDGQGVKQDKTLAVSYYEKAAAQGDPTGANNLGVMLQEGDGVPVNFIRAADMYQIAAAAGNATGQYNYGWVLLNGVGRSRDPETGYRYYRLAAAQGHVKARDGLPNPDLPGGGRLTPGDFSVIREPGDGEPIYTLTPRRTIPDIYFQSPNKPGVAMILDLSKPTKIRGDFIEVYLKWDETELASSRVNYTLLSAEVDCRRHSVRESLAYNLFKASAGGGGGVGSPDNPDWGWPSKDGPYDQALTRTCQFLAFIKPSLAALAAAPSPPVERPAPKDSEAVRR